MPHKVKIRSIDKITHDVLHLKLDKPANFVYIPGQAADICVDKPGWEEEKSCFTFVSLPADDHLEFIIKTYPKRKRVTAQLLQLKAGDQIILHEPFGEIAYKGPGLFIAGGAGITPFIAILRELQEKDAVKGSRLIFANKTSRDIIMQNELETLLGNDLINILSEENTAAYETGHISEELIRKYLQPDDHVYLCGPPPMMDAVEGMLRDLNIDEERVVKEGF